MYFPDSNKVYTIASSNCQVYLGKDNGWMLIGEDDEGQLEPFSPALCVELIVNTPQEDGVEIIKDSKRKQPEMMC